MPLFVQIIDDFGRPDAVASLADAIIAAVLAKGVGIFRTEAHVAADIRAAVNELIRDGRVSVQSPVLRACAVCGESVSIWHMFSDGTVHCSNCLNHG